MLNRAQKIIVIALAVSAVPVLWSTWNVRSTNAAGGAAWRTGMFSIARGQTARINAANVFDPDTIYVQMKFLDGAGNVVAWSQSQELRPGQARSLDYPFEIPMGQRFELRGVGLTGADNKSKGSVLFTSEVFDNDTGKTTITPAFEECSSCREH